MRYFAVAFLAVLTGPAVAQGDGLQWLLYHSDNPTVVAPGIELFYGIPRTDAVAISATCDVSSGTPFVQMTVNGGNGAAGAAATLRIGAPDGTAHTIAGQSLGYSDYLGTGSIRVPIGLAGPIWDVFDQPGTLAITPEGGETIVAPGDSQEIRDFVALCAQRGGPSCETITSHGSTESGEEISLRVTNSSRGVRQVFWLDPSGEMVAFGQLAQGESGALTTDAGYYWMFADDQGRCVETRLADTARSGIELFMPGPD